MTYPILWLGYPHMAHGILNPCLPVVSTVDRKPFSLLLQAIGNLSFIINVKPRLHSSGLTMQAIDVSQVPRSMYSRLSLSRAMPFVEP